MRIHGSAEHLFGSCLGHSWFFLMKNGIASCCFCGFLTVEPSSNAAGKQSHFSFIKVLKVFLFFWSMVNIKI
jgi:hypothetical protein